MSISKDLSEAMIHQLNHMAQLATKADLHGYDWSLVSDKVLRYLQGLVEENRKLKTKMKEMERKFREENLEEIQRLAKEETSSFGVTSPNGKIFGPA